MEFRRARVKLASTERLALVEVRIMDTVIFSCSICHGPLLSTVTPAGGRPAQRQATEKFYCPSCEMFVEPSGEPPSVISQAESASPEREPENPGRARTTGTNAGGSQRGDLSDEGASQWRKDPADAERNTWK